MTPVAAGHPSDTAAVLSERIDACDQPVFISRVPAHELQAAAVRLDEADPALPLYGIPFAVKDNIDVAGMSTTAGCPGAAHLADQTAPVVERLLDAGALLVGKTNMDQFATGLVGTRSPYGACSSVFDPARISGGSSSGSALAVALGLVSFALGTDTAGSGRVPAAFNGLVGLKPTRGVLSTRGLVPACASLDCVSILAATVAQAAAVFAVVAGFDPQDPWSRLSGEPIAPERGRIGIPLAGQAEPSDPEAAAAWARAQGEAAERWAVQAVDISALLEAAPLLYDFWIAERTASLRETIDREPDGLDPTVAALIRGGGRVRGADVFAALHRLAELRARTRWIWDEVDALLLPTTPEHPTHDQVAADPVGVNERLGRFTNFANLLDLAAVAVPGPTRRDGLPFGVTLFAPAFHDRRLLQLAAAWSGEPPLARAAPATGSAATVAPAAPATGSAATVAPAAPPTLTTLAVVGAHMSGLPLNPELTRRGARLLRRDRTAATYRLVALPGDGIRRPGLIRTPESGASIDLELWELTPEALGSLLVSVPAPLAIGRVELTDGTEVTGFVCEGYAQAGAEDVTGYGGWRHYLEARGLR